MNKPLCCYHNSLDEFLKTDLSSWEKTMITNYTLMYNENPSPSQINAWKDSYKKIRPELLKLNSNDIYLIFEYELPYEGGRRPDLVILTGNAVIIFEFKEKANYDLADIDQVAAYARDIKNYHELSHKLDVYPVLVPTYYKDVSKKHGKVSVISPHKLYVYMEHLEIKGDFVDPIEWLNSPYAPLPTLVEAARKIYEHEPLPYIRHAHSTGIPKALHKLKIITQRAKLNGERVVVFVTGVPGAGKTLLGIQFTYESFENKSDFNSVFLSGNGPLVEVLQYALKSKVFVKPLRNFIKDFGIHKRGVPKSKIIVFDEAQRAWDSEHVLNKHNVNKSEPDLIFEIADSISDWCIFMGLIGEGQEIHRGEEAGIEQWRDALGKSSENWTVICPEKLANTFTDVANVFVMNELDLTVSLRSHLAEEVTSWTESVLDSKISNAFLTSKDIKANGFDAYITKNLERAKDYCHSRYNNSPSKRYGLITSSKAKIIQEYGVDNSFYTTQRLRKGPWYYDSKDNPLSCCQFDMVATEFSCQGLELDMPVVCWGEDALWKDGHWEFKSKGRNGFRNPKLLTKNCYRVLLTRGRDGFIVYIPDDSRLGDNYSVLVESGLKVL